VPIKVAIKGKWGRLIDKDTKEETNYCLPSVTVAERYRGESSTTADHIIGSYSGQDSRRSFTDGPFGKLYDYEIVLEFSTLPTHIMKEVDFFTIALGITPDEDVYINSLSGKVAYYTALAEHFETYERKYITSTLAGEEGVSNPDGLNTVVLRSPSPSNKSNGQYFPITSAIGISRNEVNAVDKLTMIGASKFYPDNTTTNTSTPFAGGGGSIITGNTESINESGPLSVTVENLKIIEKEEQKKLYEDATTRDAYDILTLTPYTPPKFEKFIEKIGLANRMRHRNLTIKSNKLLWNKHWLVKSFVQEGLDFFTPGGHYFTWDDYVYKTRCMLFGPVETIYSAVFVHHRHGKSVSTATASEAYAGWVRVRYMEGTFKKMDGEPKPKMDLLTAAQQGY
jgi:hypothetical protein